MERTPYESISRLMNVIELSSDIVKVAPYKEEIDSIQRGLSTLSLSPCMAWETVLRMKEKYGRELSLLYAYYPYTHILIVPDVLVTNALILTNLRRLLFILPRCMLLRELSNNDASQV